MARLSSFTMVSLDGCYADAHGDMRWAHATDPEAKAFAAENAKSNGMLVFGRVTYEMMASYWPTELAAKNDAAVAEGMNRMPKVVFSKTLRSADWSGTTLVQGELVKEMKKLKQGKRDLVVLGSGTLVGALAQAGLIDEYQLLVNPLILGGGRRLFDGVTGTPRLTLESTRRFENGNVFLRYRPS